MELDAELKRLKTRVDGALEGYFLGDCPQRNLLSAMRYSLLAGGKRIRPILLLKFCEAAGGDIECAMPLACAIEMVHTYSLIHDDLPIMDDDDLRRGKPTCHKVYGECTAALAGDALQAAAFSTALRAQLPDSVKVRAAACLADAAGELGMCGGQELDTAAGSDRSPDGLSYINDLKTGALIKAACAMGAIAGGGTEEQISAAAEYGAHLARAFQIRDDMLDIISTDEELGKPVGSDAAGNKPTYASVMGLERCASLVKEETEAAKAPLRTCFAEYRFFDSLADYLSERNR